PVRLGLVKGFARHGEDRCANERVRGAQLRKEQSKKEKSRSRNTTNLTAIKAQTENFGSKQQTKSDGKAVSTDHGSLEKSHRHQRQDREGFRRRRQRFYGDGEQARNHQSAKATRKVKERQRMQPEQSAKGDAGGRRRID